MSVFCKVEGCTSRSQVVERAGKTVTLGHCGFHLRALGQKSGRLPKGARETLEAKLGRPLRTGERAQVRRDGQTGKLVTFLLVQGKGEDITCPHCGRTYGG